MAITTVNDKLAIMEFGQVWEPGLPIAPGALDQADLQQLLWGYPGVLWGEAELVSAPFAFAHELLFIRFNRTDLTIPVANSTGLTVQVTLPKLHVRF